MNTADAICHGDIDGYDDEPEYRCSECGASVDMPALCDNCQERLTEEAEAAASDPRRI